jgi:hypothetical protein
MFNGVYKVYAFIFAKKRLRKFNMFLYQETFAKQQISQILTIQ